MAREIDEITGQIVDAAVKVHMGLGPGLLESVYEVVLAKELERRGLTVQRQKTVSFEFDGIRFEEGFRVDLLVEGVVVELKSVEKLAPVHSKQVLTYLRLLNLPVGLLLNFGAATLKEGLHRIVNNYVPFPLLLRVSASPRERGFPAVTAIAFTILVAAGSVAAGFLGALTGLGGGVIIVPLLAIGFGVDLRYAIGASLVSVIATSSGAAAAYVREGYSNLRIGMFLEVATSVGAIAGAILALGLPTGVLSVVFGVALIVSALLSSRPRAVESRPTSSDRLARAPATEGLLSHAGRPAGRTTSTTRRWASP